MKAPASTRRQCVVEGCAEPAVAICWCALHHARWKQHGSAYWRPPTVEERFWTHVHKPGRYGCWEWTGGKDRAGYGHFAPTRMTTVMAHRFAYQALVGPIPDGLQLDHLCRNTSCVRPDHLEPVTARENLLRGDTLNAANARKTHCDNGHPFDEFNTYVGKEGRRSCRACSREQTRLSRERRKATPAASGAAISRGAWGVRFCDRCEVKPAEKDGNDGFRYCAECAAEVRRLQLINKAAS